jgi:hypothetical protein
MMNIQDESHPQLQVDQNCTQQQQDQLQISAGPVYLEPLSPALSTLDFMHLLPQNDKETHSEGSISVPPSFMNQANLFSSQSPQDFSADAMQRLAFGMHMNGWNTELPSYIDELLSGACMY